MPPWRRLHDRGAVCAGRAPGTTAADRDPGPCDEDARVSQVWGYCPVCQKLVRLRKVPVWLPGQRESWKPIAHDNEKGARCPGEHKHV